jgi:alpha-L-fucosidase
MVNLAVADKSVEVFYTLDGSEPSPDALKFEHPFFVNAPTTIKAVAYDGDTQHRSEIASQYFDVAKKKWKVVSVSSGDIAEAGKLIDDDPDTFWATEEGGTKPQEIVIDLGANHRLKGFTYWPIQIRYPFGIITDYTFLVSTDGKHWKTVSQGEFGNIVNNRIGQTIYFNTVEAKYIKLRANSVDGEDYRTSFGEVGIISE